MAYRQKSGAATSRAGGCQVLLTAAVRLRLRFMALAGVCRLARKRSRQGCDGRRVL